MLLQVAECLQWAVVCQEWCNTNYKLNYKKPVSIFLDTGGHGNILLKVKTKNNLQEQDTVNKNAEIFFDYNFPIETNIANTTFALLSTHEFDILENVSLYPNPVKDIVAISAKEDIKSVSLYDVQGRVLQTKMNAKKEIKINLSTYSSGTYFIRTTTLKGVSVDKIVKK